jgi:hypothetical protein
MRGIRAAHKMAIEQYSAVAEALHKMASNGEFSSQKYQRLKAKAEQARLNLRDN